MKTVLILLVLLCGCSASRQMVFPGTDTPINDAWLRVKRDTEVEYTVLRQTMIASPRAQNPEFYDKVAASAQTLEFFYRKSFGVTIPILHTVPAALAPLAGTEPTK